MENHEHELKFPVRADSYDPRDLTYPPPTRDPKDKFYEPKSTSFLAGIFAENIAAAPPEVGYATYKARAEPAWHQRGEECTGFALAAIANYHLRKDISDEKWEQLSAQERTQHSASRRMLYEMAQIFDGENYVEGSTLRGALKGWRKVGVAADPVWPYAPGDEHGEKHGGLGLERVVDAVSRPGGMYFRIKADDIANMKDALARKYPLYASASVHVGWYREFLPTSDGVIRQRPDDKITGLHAFPIVGYDQRGFWIHNSWGEQWGDDGYALLEYEDWKKHGKDVWFVIPPGRPKIAPMPDIGPPPSVDAKTTYGDMWQHLVVLGDDGRLSTRDMYGMDSAAVGTLLYLFQEHTKDWSTRRLAVVADAGYWATDPTVGQLRLLRDELMANEIYPIFLVWDTPWFTDMQGWLFGEADLADAVTASPDELTTMWSMLGGPAMAKVLAAESVTPRVWREVERRARAACQLSDGGARVLSESIQYKWKQKPFDIHLIAHGAGDHLLSEAAPLLPTPIASCTLWSPTTSMKHFHATYAPMLDDGCLRRLTVHALDDEAERADWVGPVPKSLPYLVSDVLALNINVERAAIHDDDKEQLVWLVDPEPVLGLQRFLATDAHVARLRRAGTFATQTVPKQTHIGLATDKAVLASTIADILTTPTVEITAPPSRGPDQRTSASTGDPLDTATSSDPLDWATTSF